MLNGLLDFLFGKSADIFDKNGQVLHKFAPLKWKAWNDRLKENPEYNWREHSGQSKAKAAPAKISSEITAPKK
jgi:hypothetical protein